jgi:hypothetical protein
MRHHPTLKAVLGRASAVALLSLVPLGCGGDRDTAAAPAAPSSNDVEQVQRFLDARYTENDVKHSFHTKFGETIDCIDFFAQAGVKQLAAQGRPMTRLPQPEPPEALPPEMEEVSFNGKPDDEGKPRACPAGTAPMLRLTAAHVRAAGGLDRFLRVHSAKRPPPSGDAATAPTPPDAAGVHYAHLSSRFNGASMSDGQAAVTIYAPRVVDAIDTDHSLMQTWTIGNGASGFQTVEVGWNVDPALYAGNNPQSAHLFIYSTVDNYVSTGCYNNTGSRCVPFIAAPQATFAPGQTLTAAAFGATPTKLLLRTQNGDAGYGATGWNVRGVGVYPASDYNGAMTTSASRYQVGGEVYDHTQTTTAGNGGWVVPMGSGAAANAGAGQAAYWDQLNAFIPGTGWSTSFGTPTAANASFSFLQVADRTYIGNVPDVWWGQDFGFQFSPIGEWAYGSYKGECQLGYPVTAISSNTSGGNSHALVCGQQALTTSGAGCYARALGSVDNRAFNDNGWDWDSGSLKVECESSFFVQGVAQSISGVLDAILCCPGSVAHRSCNAEIFESSDSPSYGGGPDWDPLSYKGQCAGGKYVAGVSRRSGAVHGLLCCTP